MIPDCPHCGLPARASAAQPLPALDYNLLAARLMAAADGLSRCGGSTGDYYDAVRYRGEIDRVADELRRLRGGR